MQLEIASRAHRTQALLSVTLAQSFVFGKIFTILNITNDRAEEQSIRTETESARVTDCSLLSRMLGRYRLIEAVYIIVLIYFYSLLMMLFLDQLPVIRRCRSLHVSPVSVSVFRKS